MNGQQRGQFIVFEGVEGVGKSTQARLLTQWLREQGIPCVVTREPGGTPFAELIRDLVLQPQAETVCAETELLLMMAARLQHWHGFIQPQLAQGSWVVCDRFIDSSIAYQGAGRGLSQPLIRNLHAQIAPDMAADLVLVLDLSIEESASRLISRGTAPDRMEQASQDFFRRARACFLESARLSPQTYVSVNGGESVESIALQIQQTIAQRLFPQ